MLPVSAEHPHTQIIQYPNGQPPYVPNVQLFPEGQSMLVLASSMVATEAGMMSGQSLARMFCYNMLSSAGWQNTAFAEVVKFACDYAVLRQRTGQAHSPSSVLIESVRDALSFYTSTLVMSYPDLARMVGNHDVASASHNAMIYQDLCNQINAMYGQSMGYAPPQGRLGHQSSLGPVSRLGGTVPPGRPMGHMQAPPSHPAASRAVTQPQQQIPTRYPTRPSPQQSVSQAPTMTENSQASTQTSTPTPTPSTLRGDIESMDRKAHSIVYFGKEYEVPTSPLRRKFEESVEEHENIANSSESVDTPYVANHWSIGSSLSDLIAMVRFRRTKDVGNDLSVYHSYGLVVTPIISPVDMKACFKLLSKSNTFSDVARVLTEQIDKITDKTELRHTLSYVSQIDRYMTKVVNSFLQRQLSDKGIRITSFIEDAQTLTKYLNDRYAGKHNTDYVDYQRRVLAHLFAYTHAEGDQSQKHVLEMTEDFIDEGTFCDNLVTSHAITYITATSQELGYDIGVTPSTLVASSSPMLHRLITAIRLSQSRSSKFVTSNHLIVTSDDARYMVYPISGAEGQYRLMEV